MKYILLLFLFVSCGDSPFVEELKDTSVSGQSSLNSTYYLAKTQTSVEIRWQIGPIVYDENFAVVLLRNSQGRLVDFSNGSIGLKLWMPSMGHGSYPVTIERLSQGVYKASEIFFTMPGDWEIQIQHLIDGDVFESTVMSFDL